MGTNFYAEVDDKKIHIGKRSAGWEFSFQAHVNGTTIKPYPNLIVNNGEVFDSIVSWQQWRLFLVRHVSYVKDENEELFTLADFISLVEQTKIPYTNPYSSKTVIPKNHYDYCMEYNLDVDNVMLNPEGWTFIYNDFS